MHQKRIKILVTIFDFEEARDKIMLGKERKSVVPTPEELKVIAFHEAGHTLIRILLGDVADPLHKVTILPRGLALGVSYALPDKDKLTHSKDEMIALITICMGGRVAEELVFNILCNGAHSDFDKATEQARKMVCLWGMTNELGPVTYDQGNGSFQYSQKTAEKIDELVQKIIVDAYNKARELLEKHRDKLDILAHALLEKETMYADEIYALLGLEPRENVRWVRSDATTQQA